jgi:tRNA (mo5U34)-methyltransferase
MSAGVIAMFTGLHRDWLKAEIEHDPDWFHKIELAPDLITPGWSDPKADKLPHFGMPARLDNLRVLDIGCAEGFFSFEAERRGALEVVAIDANPEAVHRFNVCRAALGSRATAFLTNIYDLSPRQFGTFDVVLFYGVLYHLRHPLLALEKIHAICSGMLLLQTAGFEEESMSNTACAKFYPFGLQSGPSDRPIHDPTVFWLPNSACLRGMLVHVGFEKVEHLSTRAGFVFQAAVASPCCGTPPDKMKAPWS